MDVVTGVKRYCPRSTSTHVQAHGSDILRDTWTWQWISCKKFILPGPLLFLPRRPILSSLSLYCVLVWVDQIQGFQPEVELKLPQANRGRGGKTVEAYTHSTLIVTETIWILLRKTGHNGVHAFSTVRHGSKESGLDSDCANRKQINCDWGWKECTQNFRNQSFTTTALNSVDT